MKKSLLLAFAVLLSAGFAWWMRKDELKEQALRYPAGQLFPYELTLSQDVEAKAKSGRSLGAQDQAILSAGARSFLVWKGRLELENHSAAANVLAFRMEADATESQISDALRSMSGELEFDARGKILSLSYSGDRWTEQATFLRDFFSSFDAAYFGAAEQEESHFDFVLNFTWILERLSSGSYEGRKQYRAFKNREGSQVEGQISLQLSADNLVLQSASMERRLLYDISENIEKSEHFKFQLRPLPQGSPKLSSQRVSGLIRDDLSGRATREELEKRIARKAIEGLTLANIMEMELNLSGSYSGNHAQVEAKVRAWLLLHPESTQEVAASALAFDANDPRFHSLFAAIRDVGHAEAQAHLRELIPSLDSEPKKQMYLAAYLADVSRPEPESIHFLLETGKLRGDELPLAQAANLGLGRMIEELEKQNASAEAERLTRHFRDLLAQSTQDSEKKHYWRVLGNSKSERIWDDIEQAYAKEDKPDMKEVILASARFLKNPEAHALLKKEAENNVGPLQFVALESLSFSPPEEGDVLLYEGILKNSKDLRILQQAIKNLGHMVPKFAKARELMRWFVKNCGHADLCSLAESYSS